MYKEGQTKQDVERHQASLKISHQLKLAEFLKSGTYYDKSSALYYEKLAIFIGTNFQDLLSTLDHYYHVPSRAQMMKELENANQKD